MRRDIIKHTSGGHWEETFHLFELWLIRHEIHSYGGREEALQLRAHDGAREVVQEGGQILSDAKEAFKK